ncbi:hypothetical protein [Segniliparus rugosus]|nr:hypothetical protein [Segniliparus rugosus]
MTGVFVVQRNVREKSVERERLNWDGSDSLPPWHEISKMVEPEPHVLAVPMLRLDSADSEIAFRAAAMLGAGHRTSDEVRRIDLPLWHRYSATATAELRGLELRIEFLGREYMTIPVKPRFAYLLGVSQSLGLNIVNPEEGHFYGALRLKGTDLPAPHCAVIRGKLTPKLVEDALGWTRMTPLADALGFKADGKIHTETVTYGADADGEFIPRNLERKKCALCGSGEGQLTREHCTPKWLADRMNVTPVVVRMLCSSCNGKFGKTFEEPVAELHEKGWLIVPAHRSVVLRWAVKTAIMLSTASGVRIPPELFAFLDGDSTDDRLTVHFHESPQRQLQGYRYTLTHFRGEYEDSFLFSMLFDRHFFVVARPADPVPPLGALANVSRWHPTHLPGHERGLRGDTQHDAILREHFDIDLEYDPVPTKPPQPRR